MAVSTDETCVINGRVQCDLPLVLDEQRLVVRPVSDWLRYQAVFFSYPSSTIGLYAEILVSFWNYLADRKVNWMDVDDKVLIEWRNYQEQELGVKKRTINQRLSTVFQFYWWAQNQGLVHEMMADPNTDKGTPSQGISVGLKAKKSRSGLHPNFTIYSPLLYRTTRQPNIHTPTADEATNLHATLATLNGPTVAERNTLMLSWAEEVGLRRMEFAALTVDQIPEWDEIYSLIEQDSLKDIELVVTKGGHRRIVEVVPDLLVRTRNYIEEDRDRIVRRFRKKYGRAYEPPSTIFVSEKTGKGLKLRAISNLIPGAFKKANVSGSGHRMRARYLTNLVEHYYDEVLSARGNAMSLDIVLLKAAEAAGHLHPETLRPYLNLVRKRRLNTDQTERLRHLDQRLLSVERTLDSKLSQLETTALMGELAKAVRSGKKSSIRGAWGKLEGAISAILISPRACRAKLKKVA